MLAGDAILDDCELLSKRDLICLSTRVQDFTPELIDKLPILNPDITILAYFPAAFVWWPFDSLNQTGAGYGFKADQCDWWLYDDKANVVRSEGYLCFTNFTTKSSLDDSGRGIAVWLAEYISEEIVSTGLWDGVLIDGASEDPTWIHGLDLGNPLGDAYVDSLWNEGHDDCSVLWKREFENATVRCNPSLYWARMADGTLLAPKDGRFEFHVPPSCALVDINKRRLDRRFDQRDRRIFCDVVVTNPTENAVYAYVWVKLTNRVDTLASSIQQERLIGAGGSLTVATALTVPTSLDMGTYCLEAFVGGRDYVWVDHDTLFVRRITDFEKEQLTTTDDHEEGSLTVYPRPAVMSGGTIGMEVSRTSTRCSVRLFDVRGRLI